MLKLLSRDHLSLSGCLPKIIYFIHQTCAFSTLLSFELACLLAYPIVVELKPVADVQGKVYGVECCTFLLEPSLLNVGLEVPIMFRLDGSKDPVTNLLKELSMAVCAYELFRLDPDCLL
jgi:hypothetical protein